MDNGSFSGSATSSLWSGGTGQFSNSSNVITTYFPSPTEVSSGSVMLTLTTNDPDGSGPCPAVSESVTITINTADFVYANGDTLNVCSGNETILFGSGADFFIWSGGIQDSIPFVPQSSAWYEVTGYASSTCFDNDFIYVHVLPSPEFALPSDTIVCSGVPFNVSNSNLNESINWSWNGTAENIPFIPITSGYLNYQSILGGCSKIDSIYLQVIQTPSPVIIGENIVCQNAYGIAYTIENWNNNSLTWTINNGELMGYIGNNMNVHWFSDTAALSSIIVTETVWGSSCSGNDTLEISFESSISLDPAQIQPLFSGSTVLYTTMDYPIMIWGFEPKSTNNETIIQNQSNQYCEFGNVDTVNYYYWVKIAENDSTCLTKSYYNSPIYSANIATINIAESLVSIYPNPVNNELFVKNEGDNTIEFYLSDFTGRTLDHSMMNGLTTRGFDISTFETGSYFFNYRSGGSWKCMKFIKL